MPKAKTYWQSPFSTWPRTAATVGGALGLVAALGGAVKAFPDILPILPAHRGYVLEQIGGLREAFDPKVNTLLLWREEDNKARLDNEISGWQIGLDKEKEPQTRDRIKATIDRLKAQREKIDGRILKLGPSVE